MDPSTAETVRIRYQGRGGGGHDRPTTGREEAARRQTRLANVWARLSQLRYVLPHGKGPSWHGRVYSWQLSTVLKQERACREPILCCNQGGQVLLYGTAGLLGVTLAT